MRIKSIALSAALAPTASFISVSHSLSLSLSLARLALQFPNAINAKYCKALNVGQACHHAPVPEAGCAILLPPSAQFVTCAYTRRMINMIGVAHTPRSTAATAAEAYLTYLINICCPARGQAVEWSGEE